MPIIKVDNEKVDIYYEIIGTGPEKVVMVMGLGCTHQAWRPTATEIAKTGEYSCLIFDNRGTGHSSVPRGRYKTSRMALDTLELIDSLGPDWNRVHVVGISMGGMISQELALLLIESNRLVSLSLFVTHAGRSSAKPPPRKGVIGLVKTFFSKNVEHKAEHFSNCLYSQEFLNSYDNEGKSMRDNVKEMYIDRTKSDPPLRLPGFLGQTMAVMTHDFDSEKLARLRDSGVPILVGTGTKDDLVDHQNSEHLATVLNPAENIVWEGAGHGLPVEKSEEFTAAILRNLKRGLSLS